MYATLTSKGRMTLPIAVRTQLGLRPGEKLLVTAQDQETIVLARSPRLRVDRLRGLLPRPRRLLLAEEMDAGVADHLKHKHVRDKNQR